MSHHVWRTDEILVEIVSLHLFRQERVERHTPLALQNEVDLSHVTFFFVDVPVFCRVFELARHESETDFVYKIWVKIATNFEKQFKRIQADDI